ncbi:MAG: DUF6056 family protein [Oscillospiraceae bacterium]|nr:DUF6056 family protein [Oscillospiraceae bacterium]
MSKEQRRTILFLLAFGAAFYAMALHFPLSGDDWQWGSHHAIEIPRLNGRYLGNLTAIMLAKMVWLRPIVMAMAVTASVYFVSAISARISGAKSRAPMLLTALLFMLLTPAIMRQVYPWSSGFANYVLPTMFVLGTIFFFVRKPDAKAWYIAAVCAWAILGQFFVEHITLYAVAASLFVTGWYIVKYKRLHPFLTALTATYVAGAALMFMHGAYGAEDLYGSHPMPTGLRELLGNVSENYFDVISPHGIANNMFLNVLIVVAVLLLIRSSDKLKTRYTWGVGIAACISLFPVYVFLRQLHPHLPYARLVRYFDGVMSALFFVGFVAAVCLFMPQSKHKRLVLFALGSVAILLAPLMGIRPLGPRLFFIVYAMLVLAAVSVIMHLKERRLLPQSKMLADLWRVAASVALAAMFVMFFGVYRRIHNAAEQRQVFIEQQLAQTDLTQEEVWIYMPHLPFEHYVWVGTPTSYWNGLMYRRFHNIPNNVRFKFISYDDWQRGNFS